MKAKSLITLIVGLIITVGLDQLIKYWVVNTLEVGEEIDLLPFLSLYHARNPGIAFSMLSSVSDWGLIALTLCIICFVIWLWKNAGPEKSLSRFGFLLVIGGAIGNLIDRIRFHYVIDYISFHINGVFSFAIFNLADSFITVGAVLIVLDELLHWKREKRKAD
ncbi:MULTISPECIES: signal peptidase II [Bartonella]|uniref:Lipoprotein signal peptidase n=1 Tax=Bartonella apis TaxID=1686310 RepID=A0A1R0FBS4_9HYPH|nr:MULTISPECIES: signal peptidase II [Bartonella]MBH9986915.1 signal peptidase II [Bartonella apis]MBI0171035.1 signal peptidase II [Bartonella sp. W8151]MCT6823987.1 signal peptidase II [Bartonella apis]MCT6860899.1 signal peptidase II [Bartonella apis]MCT6886815.1 signal peptidase II [Bartonella apis]